jgi:3-isopropylmalate/(R)-2-methylmalate dehydratase small subunit
MYVASTDQTMKAFKTHQGIVAPIDRENVDTDAIIPKQFLKSIHKTGFGPHLFDEWRYLDKGHIGQDPDSRQPNPDFVLNQFRYRDATILLAGKNFGCGSSREHAPWAIDQYGFRALIAPSFADIFFNNCFKNGLLPITLPETIISELFAEVHAEPGYRLSIDLERQVIGRPNGANISFDIHPQRKSSLLHGLDEIAQTLRYREQIQVFQARHFTSMPWLASQDVALRRGT